MKVSTRVEYGVQALADIALYSETGDVVSAPDIAERQKISHKYLEQILTQLKHAGLIRAQNGLRGGYTLSRSADTIKVSEVLNALDNSILEEMDSSEDTTAGSLRSAVNDCLWKRLNLALREFAESRTLWDLIQECSEQISGGWDMYTI